MDASPGDEIVSDLPPTENKRFYPALDGLRAVAVLLVLFQHYEAPAYPELNWGWVGVDLFFVLSGFLITGILFDTRDSPHRFRNFYVRRTLRIFPLYYGIFALALLFTPVFHFHWHRAWLLWLTYLGNYVRFVYLHDPLYLSGILEQIRAQPPYAHPSIFYVGHFWSLCVEEQFYLVWPLCVFAIADRKRLRNLCIAVCVLTLLARIVCIFTIPWEYLHAELLYRATPLRADALLLGGLVALALRGPEAQWVTGLARRALILFPLGFVVFEVGYRMFAGTHTVFHPYAGAPVMTTLGYTLIDLFAAALIVTLLEPTGSLFRFFNQRPLRWLGQISYGFYVFHDLLHGYYMHVATSLTQSPDLRRHLMSLFALLGTTVLAYLSFRFYESPFLRLKARFTR